MKHLSGLSEELSEMYFSRCLRRALTSQVCRRDLAESSDDDEHFQRKEEKRLARDKARLNPVILSKFRYVF